MTKLLGGIGEAFADRNFRIYSVGSITSWITYFIQDIAFSWLAWDVTKSTTWLAIVAGLTTGTMVAFIPLGGVLADRFDRFHMVRIAYGFDLLKTIALAALAFANALTLPVICVSAFLHGLIHSFSIPASYGMLPRFVAKSRLASCIAVNAAYTQFAVFAGPAIAGWILAHGGVAAAFSTNVVGYLIYFASTLFLVTPAHHQPAAPSRNTLWADMIEGVRYVATHRGLAPLLIVVLIGDSLSASVYKMMPAYAAEALSMGAGGMSALLSAAGLGATAAALWLAHGGAARTTAARVLWALLGLAASVLLLAGSVTLGMSFAAMLLFGFSQETRRTGTVSIFQMAIDDARRARVMSSLFLFSQIAGGLGALFVGVSAHETGLRAPLIVAALALALVGLPMFARRAAISEAFRADP